LIPQSFSLQLIISTAPDPHLPENLEGTGDDAEQAEQRPLSIDASLHGQRLDRVLAANFTEFSRSYLQQRIEAGDVLLDGQPAGKASAKVRLGQRVLVTLRETPQSRAFVPQDLPIETVYVDEHLRVVHKPAGWVVHRRRATGRVPCSTAFWRWTPPCRTCPGRGLFTGWTRTPAA